MMDYKISSLSKYSWTTDSVQSLLHHHQVPFINVLHKNENVKESVKETNVNVV
jgi:hypothetical protein